MSRKETIATARLQRVNAKFVLTNLNNSFNSVCSSCLLHGKSLQGSLILGLNDWFKARFTYHVNTRAAILNKTLGMAEHTSIIFPKTWDKPVPRWS